MNANRVQQNGLSLDHQSGWTTLSSDQ